MNILENNLQSRNKTSLYNDRRNQERVKNIIKRGNGGQGGRHFYSIMVGEEYFIKFFKHCSIIIPTHICRERIVQ